jgi:predicted ribosomally synthesized peptide with nif11-like leader
MSLEQVKAFYQQLANDEAFRAQMQNVQSKDECSQVVQNAGYNFTQDEFAEYTTQLLESTDNAGELQDLTEKELETIFGGMLGRPVVQQLYGVVIPPMDWEAQPLYGVVITK